MAKSARGNSKLGPESNTTNGGASTPIPDEEASDFGDGCGIRARVEKASMRESESWLSWVRRDWERDGLGVRRNAESARCWEEDEES